MDTAIDRNQIDTRPDTRIPQRREIPETQAKGTADPITDGPNIAPQAKYPLFDHSVRGVFWSMSAS
jgi:hypothetical protein